MKKEKLDEILSLHKKWLSGAPDGVRANLRGADLSVADLCEANLRGADLSGANLCGANLYGADLRGADLCEANLRGANLSWANLYGADLYGADLSEANLSGANLSGAKGTDTVITNEGTAFFRLQCPEAGAYTAYKKAHDLIVELEIPADALRSSATSRKCRASKAKVIRITDRDGNAAGVEEVKSNYDAAFVYRVGETVSVPDFDTDRWNECAAGIHHFITRAEAVQYA